MQFMNYKALLAFKLTSTDTSDFGSPVIFDELLSETEDCYMTYQIHHYKLF